MTPIGNRALAPSALAALTGPPDTVVLGGDEYTRFPEGWVPTDRTVGLGDVLTDAEMQTELEIQAKYFEELESIYGEWPSGTMESVKLKGDIWVREGTDGWISPGGETLSEGAMLRELQGESTRAIEDAEAISKTATTQDATRFAQPGDTTEGDYDAEYPTTFKSEGLAPDYTANADAMVGRYINNEDGSIGGRLVKNSDGEYSLNDVEGKCAFYCNGEALTAGELDKAGLSPGFSGSVFGGMLLDGLGVALLVYSAIQLFGPMLGLEAEQTEYLGNAAAIGVIVAHGVEGAGYTATAGLYTGVGIAAIYFLHNYKRENVKVVEFSCNPWQPTISGSKCEECNIRGLPCSEYQCRSLGQACELVNPGTTEESCVWINRKDVNPPIMEPFEGALRTDYAYNPNTVISPPDRGVLVSNELIDSNDQIEVGDHSMGCALAFTPLSFGVTLNEPAKCKVDRLRKPSFEEMDMFISGGLFQYNHTFTLSLPGASNTAGEGIEVENDGDYETYIRCEDANGNSNIANFIFQYCVEKGPDTTPPQIITSSFINGNPISFNRSSLDVEFYVNEPSECRWSKIDRDYESMENVMTSCDQYVEDMDERGLYTCSATLTGMKNKFDNEFYIRCLDQPREVEETKRNVNVESYKYVVKGTQPLVIDSVLPEEGDTVKDSSSLVKVTFKVETSAGFNNGESTCYYSDTGDDNDYNEFFNTNSHEHSQELGLLEGNYEYFIKCTDLGGNTDYWNMSFDVDSDNKAPLVVRAYHEETYLKLITIEEARCVYGVGELGCSYNFDDGTALATTDDLSHFVDWDIGSNLYVKCRDEFGNEPLPNQCSITAKTTDF